MISSSSSAAAAAALCSSVADTLSSSVAFCSAAGAEGFCASGCAPREQTRT
jgi:hypothetical protein